MCGASLTVNIDSGIIITMTTNVRSAAVFQDTIGMSVPEYLQSGFYWS